MQISCPSCAAGFLFPLIMDWASFRASAVRGSFGLSGTNTCHLVTAVGEPGLIRAAMALCLPFITDTWQIYVVIFLLQSASATFTPAFQSLIPTVLKDERDYTRALSLSRLAYDMEALVSPALAALLLALISYNNLFIGTVAGFLFSAFMVIITVLPRLSAPAGPQTSLWHRTNAYDMLGFFFDAKFNPVLREESERKMAVFSRIARDALQ